MKVNKSFKLSRCEVEKLAIAGGKAPSGGNIQPWILTVKPQQLQIKLDPLRSKSFIDVGKSASFLALGCFAENVCIAAQTMGLIYKIDVLEYKKISDPIIVIKFFDRKEGMKKFSHPLYPYISKRVTNRQLSDGTIIGNKQIEKLKKVASQSGKRYGLVALSGYNDKKKAAKILGKTDAIRNTNKETLRQMMEEFRWSRAEALATRDGLAIETLELPTNLEKMLRLYKKVPSLRYIIPKEAFEKMTEPLILGSSHICCYYTSQPYSSRSLVIGGMILERIWLTATKLGLAFQPWTVLPFFIFRVKYFQGEGFSKSEIEQIQKLETDLRSLFDLKNNYLPLFIFRLSKAKPPSAKSLRLSWKQYTEIKQ